MLGSVVSLLYILYSPPSAPPREEGGGLPGPSQEGKTGKLVSLLATEQGD